MRATARAGSPTKARPESVPGYIKEASVPAARLWKLKRRKARRFYDASMGDAVNRDVVSEVRISENEVYLPSAKEYKPRFVLGDQFRTRTLFRRDSAGAFLRDVDGFLVPHPQYDDQHDVWIGSAKAPRLRGTVVHMENDGPPPGWLERRDAAGSDTEYGQDGVRILRKLADDKAISVKALFEQANELLRPAGMTAVNDNSTLDTADDGPGEPDVTHGWERIHNQGSFSPSIPKLMAAYADGMRCRVTRHKNGTVTRFTGGMAVTYDRRATNNRDGFSGVGTVRIGGWEGGKFRGLTFVDGRLEFYGDRGRRLRPSYKAKVAHQVFKREVRIEQASDEWEAVENYLALPGVDMAESIWTPRGFGITANPMARDNLRRKLADACAGKQVTSVLPGIARTFSKDLNIYRCGYGTFNGVKINGIVSDDQMPRKKAPRHGVLAEIDRAHAGDAFCSLLSERTVAILDAVFGDSNYRDIGKILGYAEKSAHKSGKRAVLIAANDISAAVAA